MGVYKLKLNADSVIEPVSLSDMKSFLRVDYNDDDDLILSMIKAVRKQCENFTGRSLIEQNYSLFLDNIDRNAIQLPKQPLISVLNVKVYDRDDMASVLSSDNYNVDLIGGLVVLKTGVNSVRDYNGIEIEFTSGYGVLAEDVPNDLVEGIKRSVSYLYENRGDDKDISNYSKAINLWQDYRVVGL